MPVRPTNMSTDRTYLPASGRSAVIPVDSPHVAKAEITSNRTTSSARRVIASSGSVATSTVVAPTSGTATASRSARGGIRRPNDLDVPVAAGLGDDRRGASRRAW